MISQSTVALIILVLIVVSFATQIIPMPVTALLGGLAALLILFFSFFLSLALGLTR